MKLQYTPEAVEDLKRLHDFVATKNALSARKTAIEIQEAAQRLKAFPKIGLPVSASPNADLIRDLYVGSYTIRYKIAYPELIQVLRVWHKSNRKRFITSPFLF